MLISCRICNNSSLKTFLSLGPTPLANSFLTKDKLAEEESSYPLDMCFCEKCGLVQLSYVVPPELMFKNYLWVSGTSDTIPVHFQQLADEAKERFNLDKNSLVIDIGSNDGTLLKAFTKNSVKVLGIEPAINIAKMAIASGIETINNFFNAQTAKDLSEKYGKAKVITTTNVFAHVNDLADFLNGVDALLDTDGVFIIEVPYLVDLVENLEFDTAYHEHLSYFSLKPLTTLFDKFHMEIFDVKKVGVHGGSIRIYVKRYASNRIKSNLVKEFLINEEKLGLFDLVTYENFANKVLSLRERLTGLLRKLKSKGKGIIGYGAAAKGNTLLNFCRIDTALLDYIADKNPLKQGLYTPGMRIPVYPAGKVLEDQPDYVLILAWNFADEIMKQQHQYRERGGKFIIPLPEPRIV